MELDFYTHWGFWMVLGFALVVLETVLPNVFVIWFGLGAIVVGLLSSMINISLSIQLTIFAILSVLFSVSYYFYNKKKEDKSDKKDDLNNFNHAMLNSVGIVVEMLTDEEGRAKIGDTTWKIKGKNLSVNDKIKVHHVDGLVLHVQKQ